MLRALLSSVVAIGLVPACATDATFDELDGESELDGEAGKGDAADVFTFFEVSPDLRACSFDTPNCGGFRVSRPNRATTTCGFSLPSSSCYVDTLDLTGTAMPASVAESYKARIRAGEKILLRGEITPDPLDDGAKLTVTEVWTAGIATMGADEGVMVKVEDNGIRCITAPCASYTEIRVNSNRFAQISELDFSVSGADDAAIERAQGQLFDGTGIIVVGDRFTGASKSKGRTVNQFYTKAPVPQFWSARPPG